MYSRHQSQARSVLLLLGSSRGVLLLLAAAIAATTPARAVNILFDATKHEMAGNADWVIDSDVWNLNMPAYPCTSSTNESNPQRIPTPPQSGITATTAETYWKGGVSSWGIDLVKAGHTVETLPNGAAITFGNPSNPQDLSHYQLFIVSEPQNPFTAAEKTAILAFVHAGGGLFMIGDHETSDRDCDGWDAPHVWNDLAGATSATSTGVFGIWMRVNGLSDKGSEDWFDDGTDSNVSTDPADAIIHGPFGAGNGGLGLFGATSMEINLTDNATAQAHVWRTGQTHDTHRVTFATASYGTGRVAAIGDSSPADDGTGDSGDTLYGGWDKAVGGVNNREIHLNACAWLLNSAPDTTPPVILTGPAITSTDCSASVSWTTDEASTSTVEYGSTSGYGSSATTSGLTQTHTVALSGLSAATPYHYRVSSIDSIGNGPTTSTDAIFTTGAATPPAILTGPQVSGVTGNGATIAWTTDEPATSVVHFGTTSGYGGSASTAGLATAHSVTIAGLAPGTTYHFQVLSTDGCGQGPTGSTDATFATTGSSLDLSGWSLRQYNSALTYTFPAGTTIPAGGYLIVARDAAFADFQAAFPSMPASTMFLDSNAAGSCTIGCFPQISGGQSFDLYDATNVKRDGTTVTVSAANTSQRTAPGASAGSLSSWTVVGDASANPGQGAGTGSGAGVVINEIADASDYRKQFVELYYDAITAPADTTPPAAVTNLAAAGSSASSIQLSWTATGNDGSVGTASSYDLRMSLSPIATDATFASATRLSGLPAPKAAGSAESFGVTGLTAATTYHFAMKVADGAGNISGLSNDALATTSVPVGHLVISQIRVSGSADDVVELYNPTASAISLSGYSVQYLAANGNFGFRVNLSTAGNIPSHGWYLVAANGYAGTPTRDDSLVANNLSATAGHAVLALKTTNITGCTDATIVDKVGYGATASCPEGGSGHNTTQPTGGLSVTRKPGGCAGSGTDTDFNDADFGAPATPVFHNAASTTATPTPTALNNGPICEGGTLQLTASTVAGATYAWTGPNGFTSNLQNPTVQNAAAAASGTYAVTVNGCTSATTSATVIANGASCSDGSLCTTNDACAGGSCTGAPIVCSALDQCHVAGACDAATGQCSNPNAPNGSACSDGNACTQTDTCQSGVCSGSNTLACAASDQCHAAGTCDPATGTCSNPNAANGTACDDGNACTQSDSCQSGTCVGASPVTCTVSDQCHVAGTCDPQSGFCTNPAATDGTTCNDGNACTQTDICQSGVCSGSNTVVCTASDQCHVAGTCNPATGTCSNSNAANGTACNDGNACTQADTCQEGVCVGASAVVCVASDQCHVAGVCNPASGNCSNPTVSDGTVCSDGNSCTQTDTCQSGACVGSNPVVCTASDQCHVAGACNPATGTCSNPAAANGTTCNDGNQCSQLDTCQNGTCLGSNPVVCTASDQCHVEGVCNPASGTCSNPATADGTACNDGNACTTGDVCSGGTCAGTAITAPPETQNLSTAADKATYSWSAAAFATRYDVVRGDTGALPVGPGGGDEVCFDNLTGTSMVDPTLPAPGTGFWYLSRGENACGIGTFGNQSSGSPRTTTTCP